MRIETYSLKDGNYKSISNIQKITEYPPNPYRLRLYIKLKSCI